MNRFAEFITQFRQLNFANDAEMEQRLNVARNELLGYTAEHYRDSAIARQRLVSGLGTVVFRSAGQVQSSSRVGMATRDAVTGERMVGMAGRSSRMSIAASASSSRKRLVGA